MPEGCGLHMSLVAGWSGPAVPLPPLSHLAAGGFSCLLCCKYSTIEKAPLSVEASLVRSAMSAQPGLGTVLSHHQKGERSQGTSVRSRSLANHIGRCQGKESRKQSCTRPGWEHTHCLYLDVLCFSRFLTCGCSHRFKPTVHTILCPAVLLITYKPLFHDNI